MNNNPRPAVGSLLTFTACDIRYFHPVGESVPPGYSVAPDGKLWRDPEVMIVKSVRKAPRIDAWDALISPRSGGSGRRVRLFAGWEDLYL